MGGTMTVSGEGSNSGENRGRLLSEEIVAQRIKAQKRAALGLEPERGIGTTGRVTYRPAQSAPIPLLRWSAVILAVLLLLAAVWFILYTQPPRGSGVVQNSVTSPALGGAVPGEVQLLRYDFDQPVPTMAQHNEPGAWAMGFVEGRYRIRSVTSNALVYTTLGLYTPDPHRLETEVTISAETPWGFAGIMARVQNGENFYLFQIDGTGQFKVSLLVDGTPKTLSGELTPSPVQVAGRPNLLGVSDDGESLTFTVNGVTVAHLTDIALPTGDLALVGGSKEEPGSEADFDWVAVYQIP